MSANSETMRVTVETAGTHAKDGQTGHERQAETRVIRLSDGRRVELDGIHIRVSKP